ncbi:MAG: GMC oxidoreductase [Planctomyces sp.]
MFIVVGSGPAGVACAMALVEAGLPVTMVDGGESLEASISSVVTRMSMQSHADWLEADRQLIQGKVETSARGVQLKKLFGSDFPYRSVDQILPNESVGIGHLTASLAIGGFSNVWGAAALQYGAKELKGWPLDVDDLEPAYKAVSRFMPISSDSDELDSLYPRSGCAERSLRRSRQAEAIFRLFERDRERFRRAGILFGGPRLAVRPHVFEGLAGAESVGCSYCGQCLFGCPYGCIYSAVHTLERLKKFGNFHHLAGVVIDGFDECGGTVTICGRRVADGERVFLSGKKLFLAAGVVSTTRILLNAIPVYNQTAVMKTSEYFMLPLLTVRNYWGGNSDLLHTLSQMFLECVDDEVSSHNIHMQLYTYSDMFKIALDQMGFGARLLTSLFRRQLLGRLLVIQGYLHSDDSSTISMSLGKGGVLRLVGNQSLRGGQVVRRLMATLLRVLPFSGVIPLVPMLKVGLPGEGRHAGGAFPMSATPGPLEVDVSCRPAGLRHVHVVDASVFPTVPAATITLTAMANAYRVGKSVATE